MAFKIGNGDNNVIFGTSTDDDLWGMQGDDVLIGGGGNDTLNGGLGADTMDGGTGDDIYIVDNINDKVVEYAGNGYDTVRASISYSLNWAPNVECLVLTGSSDINGYGSSHRDTIYGNSGDNFLYGYGDRDELHGGAGNDTLVGGADMDNLYGGIGDDTYIIDGATPVDASDGVFENAGEGTDTVISTYDYKLDPNVENLVLKGSAVYGTGNELDNDITGNSADNVIDGGAGVDTMRGGAGNDTYYVDQITDVIVEFAGEGTDSVYSTAAKYGLSANVENLYLMGSANISGSGNGLDNLIVGNSGNNTLYGWGGSDTLVGGAGADTMYGGDGNDQYVVDNASDVVVELANQGTDSVFVLGNLSYALSDNVENLYLDWDDYGVTATGNAMNNNIGGSLADNVIDGGLGEDYMMGYSGNDTYYVDNVLDFVKENANEGNDVVYSTVNYTLSDNVEVLSLYYGNAVFGTGNGLANTIGGNVFDNVLDGGGGADVLWGFGGNDTFVFNAGQANGDSVMDFDGNGAGAGDVLMFVGYGTAAQGATFVQLTDTDWQINSANGLIHETITLAGAPTIHASDFMFV